MLCIIPGVLAWVFWALAAPALVLERGTFRAAFARSVKLVGGAFWRVLGVLLLARIIGSFFESIIQLPFTLGSGVFGQLLNPAKVTVPGTGDLLLASAGQIVAGTISIPFISLVTVIVVPRPADAPRRHGHRAGPRRRGAAAAGVVTFRLIDVPVDIDRDAARRAAEEELSDPKYRDARPGFLQQIGQWLGEQLEKLLNSLSSDVPGGIFGVVLVVALLIVLVVVIRLRTGKMARAARADRVVFGGKRKSAADYRRSAEEAAAAAGTTTPSATGSAPSCGPWRNARCSTPAPAGRRTRPPPRPACCCRTSRTNCGRARGSSTTSTTAAVKAPKRPTMP